MPLILAALFRVFNREKYFEYFIHVIQFQYSDSKQSQFFEFGISFKSDDIQIRSVECGMVVTVY